jgi:energy-coupling factor transporter ATP-binding protein EcfA2
MAEWAEKKIEELSKGMQQKIQFICTVLHKPELIILDEPFTGLDPHAASVLQATLERLRRERRTLLVTTHDLGRGLDLSDRWVILDATAPEPDVLRAALQALGARLGLELAAGFDLRTPQELAAMAPGVLFENGARHHHLPFIPSFDNDPEKMRAMAFATGEVAGAEYVALMEQSHACFAGLFAALADDESYPAAFFCAAGKDRTGMVSAVLLRALGVSDEQIIDDYALSGPPDVDRLRSRMEALGRVFDGNIDRTKLAAQPDTMLHFLRVFDSRYGSAEAFLAGCGVPSGVIERVREHLLEA